MANPFAGEVGLVIDGQRHVMKLTLGALAELEAALEGGSLVEMVARAGKPLSGAGPAREKPQTASAGERAG